MDNKALEALKRDMLDRMYIAEFNEVYHDLLHRKYASKESWLRMSLAVSGAIVCVGMKVSTAGFWTNASCVITIFSTMVVPLIKWNKLIPVIEGAKLRWIVLKDDYQNLWQDSKISGDWDDALKELKKLRKKDSDLARMPGLIPSHDDLLKKARGIVIARHPQKQHAESAKP
jgi:hypothetical protein